MSPNLAHVKDLRPETNRLVRELADWCEYVVALTDEAEELRDKVTTLEDKLLELRAEIDSQCDAIEDLERQLKEARA